MPNQEVIVAGSVADVCRREGRDVAEGFLSVDAIVMVDTSYSMDQADSAGHRRRYDVAVEELTTLQRTMPGKIAVVAFSDEAIFCPGGQPPFLGGGTNLAGALRFCLVADSVMGMRIVVISDGQPDDEQAALAVAQQYQHHIDVVYVGPQHSPQGRDFLERLAAMTGGKLFTADRAQELAAQVTRLLTAN